MPGRRSRRRAHRHLLIVPLALALSATAGSAQDVTRNPAAVRIESGDVARLAAALRLAADSAPGALPQIIQREYIERATPGFRAWLERYGTTAERIARAVAAHPDVYDRLDSLAAAAAAREPAIRAGLRELAALFPEAVFPPVWLFIGDRGPAGLARPEGVLIALERVADDPDALVALVLHETAHIQSAMLQGVDVYRRIFGPDQTLLALALREGSAEFMAWLTTGGHINPAAERYGLSREAELWEQFRRDMHNREPGEWLFVRPADGSRPADLGYWIGYRIVRSYYENAVDKRQAILDILGITDFAAFLEASGYESRMRRQLRLELRPALHRVGRYST
jgi:hypothetical protein